jgi:hypothetical protein
MQWLPFTLRESNQYLVNWVDQVSCRMLDVADADKLAVPLGLFPSKDEPITEVYKLASLSCHY